jgi:hypothetical protein
VSAGEIWLLVYSIPAMADFANWERYLSAKKLETPSQKEVRNVKPGHHENTKNNKYNDKVFISLTKFNVISYCDKKKNKSTLTRTMKLLIQKPVFL